MNFSISATISSNFATPLCYAENIAAQENILLPVSSDEIRSDSSGTDSAIYIGKARGRIRDAERLQQSAFSCAIVANDSHSLPMLYVEIYIQSRLAGCPSRVEAKIGRAG
jgi:hypothetical protein